MSGNGISGTYVPLTGNRVPAFAIWHFLAYADSSHLDARDSDLTLTVLSTQLLVFAAVFTTALPVVTKMPQRQHEFDQRPWQSENPVQPTLKAINERVESKKTAPARPPQDAQLTPVTPPPSPLLPPRATPPASLSSCPPMPQLSAPAASPSMPDLSRWASNSTLRGSTNDGSVYNATVPLSEWSPVRKD